MLKNYLLIFTLLLAVSCKKETVNPAPVDPNPPVDPTTFTNPLLSTGPDPWVIQKDSFYYYTHTSGDRIRIWKTKSMSSLNSAAPVTVWTKPSSGPNSEHVWAPELHYINNKWYLYYTAGSGNIDVAQRLFVLENSAADPTQGTWIDKGQVKDTAADFWAIDANILNFKGSDYIVWSGHTTVTDLTQRIYISRLQNPWTLATGRSEISSPTFNWEKVGSYPTVNEGPQLIINPAGNLVIVYSASGCWTDDYCMGVLVLKANGNPLLAQDWAKSPSPIFTKDANSSAYGPGHCAFFKSVDKTEDWFIYHANSGPNQECKDSRNPRMQKFTWNTNGTPNLGTPVKINTAIKKPSGE
jgi:GH43 family beta-xylosidase